MSKTYQFYALFNEEFPQEWRYIGVTTRPISNRFSQHKYCANHDSKRALPVHKWMYSVYQAGGKIGWIKIHECNESSWESEEQRLISEYSKTYKLLNLDKGGRGVITKEKREVSGIQRSIDAHKKGVIQLDKTGMYVNKYESVIKAAAETGTSRTSIGNCLKGRAKTAGGYVWKYEEDYNPTSTCNVKPSKGRNIRVFKYSPNMKLIEEYNSVSKAIIGVCKSTHSLAKRLDTNELYEGYYWFTSKQAMI